ncbi:uncharacterized protein LOC143785780 isoform X1 [Ranitomeya variabilis]|uniref:uncharacterized protein LOC143785780 isoform X1 n=1 Tax=Ranitomeya variabilis TaxID=490064 RepID=UPI004056A8E6
MDDYMDEIFGVGDHGFNRPGAPDEKVQDGRGEYRVMWDAEEEQVDENIRNVDMRERRPRRPRVDLEELMRAWMELEAQEGTEGPSAGMRNRISEETEGGETSEKMHKKTPRKKCRKNKKRRK